jgi:type II secretory pathway component PulM
MRSVSSRERVVLIAAATVLAALAIDFVLLSPLLERRAQANLRLQAARQEINRGRQVAENDLRAIDRWTEMAGATLASDSSSAESQVFNRAREWAQAAGLSITAIRPERNERHGDLQRITLRASATGTMQQVGRFLFAVQNADIPLRVSDLQVTARREGADDLSVQIGLSTIYLSPEPRTGTEVRR